MADESTETRDMETEVEDTDADTRDIGSAISSDYSMVLEELRMIRAENAAIKGQLNSLQAQRSITIDAGAVIQDDTEPTMADELIPYSQLDFTIR